LFPFQTIDGLFFTGAIADVTNVTFQSSKCTSLAFFFGGFEMNKQLKKAGVFKGYLFGLGWWDDRNVGVSSEKRRWFGLMLKELRKNSDQKWYQTCSNPLLSDRMAAQGPTEESSGLPESIRQDELACSGYYKEPIIVFVYFGAGYDMFASHTLGDSCFQRLCHVDLEVTWRSPFCASDPSISSLHSSDIRCSNLSLISQLTCLPIFYIPRHLFLIIGYFAFNLCRKACSSRLIMAVVRLTAVQASSSHETIAKIISEETKRLRRHIGLGDTPELPGSGTPPDCVPLFLIERAPYSSDRAKCKLSSCIDRIRLGKYRVALTQACPVLNGCRLPREIQVSPWLRASSPRARVR
jgi:hypothetical protein